MIIWQLWILLYIYEWQCLQLNHGNTKYIIVERKNSLKQNTIGQWKVKNYTFERVENFKYLSVILNEDNNHHIDL